MSDLGTALEFVPAAIVAIVAISNPFSTATMFLILTRCMSHEERLNTATRSAIYSLYILLFFAITGLLLFQLFGFSIGAFRIAGGILLMITAIGMLNPKPAGEMTDCPKDIALIPLAVPFISGPATIVTVIVLMSGAQGRFAIGPLEGTIAALGVFLGIFTVTFLSYLAMKHSERIFSALRAEGRKAISRLMGLIVLAISVQFIINGIGDVLPDLIRAAMEGL
jgi:multiple antibiotic resistance protein